MWGLTFSELTHRYGDLDIIRDPYHGLGSGRASVSNEYDYPLL